MIKLIIFDLDDVLFPEISYVVSGFKAVSFSLAHTKIKQHKIFEKLNELFNIDNKKVFDRYVASLNLSQRDSLKMINSMIKNYHRHNPIITLYPDAMPVLKSLRSKRKFIAIVTDGNAQTQRLKIESLGLEKMVDKIIYTDSLGPNRVFWKPSTRAFQILLDRFKIKAEEACYVGDNINKDFDGPAKLGMQTILIRREDGIYVNSIDFQKKIRLGLTSLPAISITSLFELEKALIGFSHER